MLSSTLSYLAKRSSKECVGTAQQCEKPTSSNYTKAILLGVLIPVAVIAVIFAGIFMHLKRKAQKEQQELQEDPDFDGNLDFYEYDTPQIANAFNQANQDKFLVNKESNVDHTQETGYEMDSNANNRYNAGTRRHTDSSNPFQ